MSKVQSKSKKPVEIEEDSSEEEVVVPKKQVKTTQGAAKAKAPAKKVVESSDEESEEEVIKPAAKGKTAQKATTKAAAKKVESDSEESELEEVAPKGKKAAAKPAAKPAAKKAPVVESSDEESEEAPKPAAKKAAAPVKKAPAKKVESSEEESDEESTPKVAPKKAAPVKAAAKKVVESSEEESEEEVKPATKKAAPAKKVVKEESEEEESEEEAKPAAKTAVPAVADDGNYEVIVKGLPFAAADHDVNEYFKEAGEIANINLLKGPDGRSKGIAFVKYSNNEGLSTALTYSGMDFGGRQIVVEKTTPKGQRNDNAGGRGGFGNAGQGRGGALASAGDFGPKSERDPNSCSIFVGNLSWGADENSLAAFFESCGTVQNVRVARDPEGKARGFGHVDFTSPDAVTAAVALAGGNLEGRPVRVDYATGKKNQDGGARGGFGGGGRGGFGGGFGGGRGGAPGGGRMNLSEEDAGRKKGSISSFQGQKQRL